MSKQAENPAHLAAGVRREQCWGEAEPRQLIYNSSIVLIF